MLADDTSVAQGDLEQLLATDQQHFADLLAAGAKADQELADLIAVGESRNQELADLMAAGEKADQELAALVDPCFTSAVAPELGPAPGNRRA